MKSTYRLFEEAIETKVKLGISEAEAKRDPALLSAAHDEFWLPVGDIFDPRRIGLYPGSSVRERFLRHGEVAPTIMLEEFAAMKRLLHPSDLQFSLFLRLKPILSTCMDAAIETPRMDLVICSLVEFVRGCLGEEHPADMYRDLWGQHGPFYVPWDDELGSEEDNYDPGVVGRHEGEEELIAGVWLGERRSRAVFDDSQALAEYFSVSVIDEETRVSAKVALEPALVALPWYERDLARKLFGEAISAVLCERKRQQLRRKELAK